MIFRKEILINIMAIDATFWVAISFIIFFGGLIYLKIPQKINELLNKLILDIKNEIDESEKLRQEAKVLLDNAQNKLDTAQTISNDILRQAKKDIATQKVPSIIIIFNHFFSRKIFYYCRDATTVNFSPY